MKIQIEQAEIEKAVREFVANQGIKIEGKDLTVEFRMTRVDGGGLVANLSIDDPKPTEVKPVPKPRAGSVGAAIAKQSEAKEKPDTKPAPTTAKEAIDQALSNAAAAATETKAEDTGAPASEAQETGEVAAVVDGEAGNDAAAEETPKKTTSLFS